MTTNLPPTAPIEPEPLWITAIVKGPDVACVDRLPCVPVGAHRQPYLRH
jgi:hypothetical protein